jgi:hypothetical protein
VTLPNERTRAVHNAREFLRSLLDPKKTPKVPKSIRREAYYVLKHFPSDFDMEYACDGAPSVFEHIEEFGSLGYKSK